MRTYTAHIALSQAGESQVIIGAGLTVRDAKARAKQSIMPFVQMVTVKFKTADKPRGGFAVMGRDEDGVLFFDRFSLEEPVIAKGEILKHITF